MVTRMISLAKKIPGAHGAFITFMNFVLPDNKVVKILFGPNKRMQLKRSRTHQAWMALGLYEREFSEYLSKELTPGMVFYDIGANAGYYTLLAAHRVGSLGHVVAFEPFDFNAKIIQEQVGMNGFSEWVQVEQMAVSDGNGVTKFEVPSRNANAHLLEVEAPNVNDRGEIYEVQTTRLDDYVANHRWPDVIKMDIEGAEVVALHGMEGILKSPKKPLLLISTHSSLLDQQVKSILAQSGYDTSNMKSFEQMVIGLPR